MSRGAYNAKTERSLPCRQVVIAAYANRLSEQCARIVHRRIVERWTWQAIADAEIFSDGEAAGKRLAIYDVQKIFRQSVADLTKYLESKGTLEHAKSKPEPEQLELIA